jgi:hypothetical protein
MASDGTLTVTVTVTVTVTAPSGLVATTSPPPY